MYKVLVLLPMFFIICSCDDIHGQSKQIEIPVIEQMPNMPEPYKMRDWQQVAADFDSMVFDFDKTGEYLPLIRMAPGFNQDKTETFALPTFVGDTRQTQEAITALGAINAASVAGIDKSNQEKTWVEYVQFYFNDTAYIDLYLNSHTDSTGGTFWYELLPNILFYRIYSYYPNVEEFRRHFISVANQMHRACVAMGGKTEPWKVPDFNYTAFDFKTMEPVDNNIWKEAGSAGAIAWLQYMAYVETGQQKHLNGARWGMDFLEELEENPFYEALLPHAVYTAARMNAELGTSYDVEKLFNWCFDGSNRRTWGVTTGRWGDMDCTGLVGSVYNGREFAFAMNTFNLASSLVPVARYDQRFARAIGKWMLNAANSARFFYAGYLPPDHQTDYAWAGEYDPDSCLAYEGLRSEAIYIDRIKADIGTEYGAVLSGNYRDTIFADKKYQVFIEELSNGKSKLEHVWKIEATPAQKYILNIVGKSDSDSSLTISYSDSSDGPFEIAGRMNFKADSTSVKTVNVDIPSGSPYLKISSSNSGLQPARFYIDDIYLESFTGKAPYATGDAKSHRWGNTNFGLYGSSFVGIFGGIVDKTDVQGILQLDLLATDYFREEAYPSYLYYNPHDKDKKVTLNVEAPSDLYDTLTQSFVARNVSGQTSVSIVADSARIIVIVPEGYKVLHKNGRLLINDILIDYHAD